MNQSTLELSAIGVQLAINGVAVVATEEMLAAQLKLRTFAELEANIRKSVYWEDFCRAARAGLVPADWLPGVLGSVVLNWAKVSSPLATVQTVAEHNAFPKGRW